MESQQLLISFYFNSRVIKYNYLILVTQMEAIYPCTPSPCGPNSQCRELNNQAVCSCLPSFIGNPPMCRPECTTSAECPTNLACVNNKCVDPCPGVCGQSANCRVINHSPLCICNSGFTGDPFSICYPIQST